MQKCFSKMVHCTRFFNFELSALNRTVPRLFFQIAFAAGFKSCSGDVKLGQTVTGENIVRDDNAFATRFCFTPKKTGRQQYQANLVCALPSAAL